MARSYSASSGERVRSDAPKSNLSDSAKAEIQARYERAQARYKARLRAVENSNKLRERELALIKSLQEISERESKGNSVQSDAPTRNKDLNTKVAGGSVETWYDKPTRSWVSQIKDTNGNQIGDAEYTGSGRDSAKKAHDFLVGEAERRIRDNG